MKAIVTGGAGFIGSNFCYLSLENGWFEEILVIDKLNYAASSTNIPKGENVKFEKLDIAEIPSNLLQQYDYLFNFAAETHVDNSIANSLIFTENNILNFHKMLEKIRKVPKLKLIQISTDEVYGSIKTGSFNEKSMLDPRNPYSATKAAAELLVLSYVNTYNLQAKIVRSSNNYGLRQYPEKLIPKTISNFLKGKPIGVYGSGENVRDWTHVTDNCEGIFLVSQLEDEQLDIFNISSNDERRNIDVIKLIQRNMGVSDDLIEFIKDRPGHDFRYSIDSSKIRDMGWKPKVKFENGIREIIDDLSSK